jgi:glycosyltransferase involved in cell wall biosynthesis
MSSIANLPIVKTLNYWNRKLRGKKYRKRFLLTKTIEVVAFKGHCEDKDLPEGTYSEFPTPLKHTVPNNPSVSIVIPTYIKDIKDARDIANLINSIERQTLKPDRVILVDDCSPKEFCVPGFIHYVRLDRNSGPARARNTGKSIATELGTDIVAFTDTDCVLSDVWVENITLSFKDSQDFHILSGNTVSFDKGWFGKYHDINGTLNGRVFKDSDRLLYGTTANLAITAEVANEVHFNEGFPFAAGEDIDFCFRANMKGFAIKHIPKMTIFHHFGYSSNPFKNISQFRSLFKKYGKGESLLLKEIPNYYSYLQRTEGIESKPERL